MGVRRHTKTSKKRHCFTSQFKFEIVMEGLRGEKSVAAICQERGITEADGLQIGRMLNARYVLLGSVGTLGSTYTLAARLLDVETGGVVGGRQVVCEECRVEEVVDAAVRLAETVAR